MIRRLARIYLLLVGLCLLCCDKGVTTADWYAEERTILPDPATGDTVELDSEYLMGVEAIANEIIYPVPFDSESRETLEVSELVVEDYVWNEKTKSWIIGIRPIGFSYRGRGGSSHFLFRWYGGTKWEELKLLNSDGDEENIFTLYINSLEISPDCKNLLVITQQHFSAFQAPNFVHVIDLSSGLKGEIDTKEVSQWKIGNRNIELAGWLDSQSPFILFAFADHNYTCELWTRLFSVYDFLFFLP